MREITFTEALREALRQEMERDPEVFLVGQNIGKQGGDLGVTRGLWAQFGPKRVKDTPISEAAMVGLSNGAAFTGMRPVVEIMYADFISECFDQIVNIAAKTRYMFGGQHKVSMVLRTPSGAGMRFGVHHSQAVEGWLLNVPGLTVVAPSSPYDAKGLLIASIREDNPVVFLENKALYASKGPVPEEPYALPLYQSKVKREGKDVTLVATMKMVEYALNVASEMLDDGVSIEVIDPMTLSPVDMHPVIESVKKTGRLVVVYDGPMSWGWGSEIVARVSEKCLSYLKAAPVRVAGLDVPIPAAPNLEDFVVPNEMDIRQGIISVLK